MLLRSSPDIFVAGILAKFDADLHLLAAKVSIAQTQNLALADSSAFAVQSFQSIARTTTFLEIGVLGGNPTCRRLQSSALVLANGADSCSD